MYSNYLLLFSKRLTINKSDTKVETNEEIFTQTPGEDFR